MAAVTDAYATAAEYRGRVDKSSTVDDALLGALLLAVSRQLDKECERFFTQDATAVTRDPYDGNGLARVWLPDDIATATGLIVTADLDGDYSFADETALTLDTDFWLGPPSADKGPEPRPWQFLEVHPDSTRLSVWPKQRRAIKVTAKFGWPAVPGAIKEATVLICRELIDLEKSGFTLILQNLDQAINLSPTAFGIMQRIKREYGRRMPVR